MDARLDYIASPLAMKFVKHINSAQGLGSVASVTRGFGRMAWAEEAVMRRLTSADKSSWHRTQ